MKNDLAGLLCVLLLTIALASCSGAPPTPANRVTSTQAGSVNSSSTESSPALSPTTDPCSTELIEAEVQEVHNHMREFDDASFLASNLPREQLEDSIANLQRIRRQAEDEQIAACLTDLKKYQVEHMNSVINTLVAFMGGTSQEALEQSISAAREQHDQYTLELARLLGLTVVPATQSIDILPSETAGP